MPRGVRPPSIDYPPTCVHVFAADTFELGREKVLLESGEEITIYSPERSVVDAMRLRGQVGTDVAYEALRRYLRHPGSSADDLLRLARQLRAGGPMVDGRFRPDYLNGDRTPLIAQATALFAERCTMEAVAAAEQSGWSADLWRELEQRGLTLVGVPRGSGGTGGTLGTVFEETVSLPEYNCYRSQCF